MGEPPAVPPCDPRDVSSEGHTPDTAAAGAMDELRRLLLGREQVKLDDLERRIVDPSLRVEDVSAVLPQAVARCAKEDGRLAGALAPAVEASLRTSIRRDPGVLATAIFPIIGPAIRKAVGEAFRRIMQTFSAAMEHSFSWRGLRWRWDAWRTGRPMAEVVLYHTLLYRVEQVFLIHRPSGLLLLHAELPGAGTGDEDLVAGMLSAVRDFVRDSFSPAAGDELHSVQVGERSVWVEAGPHAILAAAIRGHAPMEFRLRLQTALERMHALDGVGLAGFAGGDVSAFESLRPEMEACLEEHRRDEAPRAVFSWKAVTVLACTLLLLLVWWGVRWRERSREADLVERLRGEPGILVTRTERDAGRFTVEGLRDPLAVDPWRLAQESGVATQRLRFRWEPYLALTEAMVMRRVEARYPVAAGVRVEWRNGGLEVAGTASEAWWKSAREAWHGVPGVDRIDSGGLVVLHEATWQELARDLAERTVVFAAAQVGAEGQDAAVREVATAFERVLARARAQGVSVRLRIVGHADRSGAEAANLRLSQQRAEWVRERLVEMGVARAAIEVLGMGTRAPVARSAPEAAENRRVTFLVEKRE